MAFADAPVRCLACLFAILITTSATGASLVNHYALPPTPSMDAPLANQQTSEAEASRCLIQAGFHSALTSQLPSEARGIGRNEDIRENSQLAPRVILFSSPRFHTSGPVVWISLSLFCLLFLCGSVIGGMITKWAWKHAQSALGDQPNGKASGDDDNDSKSSEDKLSDSLPDVSGVGDSKFCESYTSGKLYEEYVEGYWKRYSAEAEPDIFGHDHLRVSTDGGMGRVSDLKPNYLKATHVIVIALFNVFLVMFTDIVVLLGHGPPSNYGTNDFLFVKWIAQRALTDKEQGVISRWLNDDINMLVPFLELLFMLYVLFTICVYSTLSVAAPRLFSKRADMRRWSFASSVVWYYGPQLASCSALRLLYFLVPKVLRSDGYLTIKHAWQTVSECSGAKTFRHYAQAGYTIVYFVISRIFALILGFDAFLVKFRLASNAVGSGMQDLGSTLGAVAFLWQIVGIINLDWFLQDRLFVFLFAGKDGSIDIDELALVEVWKALLFRKVVECHGLCRGIVVMLAFDDYDMQRLALDDDELMIDQFVGETMALGAASKSFKSASSST